MNGMAGGGRTGSHHGVKGHPEKTPESSTAIWAAPQTHTGYPVVEPSGRPARVWPACRALPNPLQTEQRKSDLPTYAHAR